MSYCPNCGTKIDNHSQKFCSNCGSPLTASDAAEAHTNEATSEKAGKSDASSTHLSLLEQELLFKQRKKNFAIALGLNVLWAGAGIFYAKAENGGLMCTLTFVAWLISFGTPIGFTLVFGMFIWASISCYQKIELDNQALRVKIAKGQIS